MLRRCPKQEGAPARAPPSRPLYRGEREGLPFEEVSATISMTAEREKRQQRQQTDAPPALTKAFKRVAQRILPNNSRPR